MRRTIVLSIVSITLLGSAALLAQAQQPPPAPPAVISFFVAQNPNQTGNLGGLAGADQMCQTQAQALGGANAARTWRAYLSQEQRGNTPRVNALERIGPGPWFNVKGCWSPATSPICMVTSSATATTCRRRMCSTPKGSQFQASACC